MKLKITYPYYAFATKDIEVSEEKFDEISNMSYEDQARFIREQLEDDGDAFWTNTKDIAGALDAGYAKIRKVNQ